MTAKACLTCAEIKTYAIKIDDFNAFRSKINSELALLSGQTLNDKILMADILFAEKFKVGLSNTDYEKIFLEYFNNHNISLYEANNDYSNWSKLSLSNNPLQPIDKTPCN
jgi:hypothetical protein